MIEVFDNFIDGDAVAPASGRRMTTANPATGATYRNVSWVAPFGGFKQSGYGRDNGLVALDGFLTTKTVWIEIDGATRDPFVLG